MSADSFSPSVAASSAAATTVAAAPARGGGELGAAGRGTDGAVKVASVAGTAADGAAPDGAALAGAASSGEAVAQEPVRGGDRSGERAGPGKRAGALAPGSEGTVMSLAASEFALQAADGSTSQVLTDSATSFVLETPIEASGITAGELVRVQYPFPLEAGDGTTVSDASIASLVTVLPPDAEPSTVGRGSTLGTVDVVADAGIVLELLDGQATFVPTGADTSFVRSTELDADGMQVGDLVKVQFPRGPDAVDAAEGTVGTAVQVTVTLPAATASQ